MPAGVRLPDNFTTENILLGKSQVIFAPKLASGNFGVDVPLGILQSQSFERERETLKLPDDQSGITVTAREIVSKLEPAIAVQLFNFRSDIAQYIFGSESIVSVVADAAAVITDELFTLPPTNTFDLFKSLNRSSISEASVAVTCDTLTLEVPVGVLDGANFQFDLAFKVKATGDLLAVIVDGVDLIGTATLTSTGAQPGAGNIDVVIGEVAASGEIRLGTPPVNGGTVLVTYKPSFSGADFLLDTDFFVDPVFGRIRFIETGAAVGPVRDAANSAEQPLLVSYTYAQLAGVVLKPYTKGSVEGKLEIRHFPSIGANFLWPIPKVSLILNADAITFGSDDFITGSLNFTILDAGGTERFGSMTLSNETESGNV